MKSLNLQKGTEMNSIAEIKSGLHHYIAETDDIKTLAKLQKYVAELLSKGGEIIAYKSDGMAMNQAAYKTDIDQAIKESKRGNTLSIDEIEQGL